MPQDQAGQQAPQPRREHGRVANDLAAPARAGARHAPRRRADARCLCARQLAVERISLLLEHERGRVARPPTVIEIVLAEAVWREEHLLRLLKERLAQLALDAPVIGLCLEALQVQPMAPPSASLFPEPGGSPQAQRMLLVSVPERIEAGWWSQSQARDYFIAEGRDHAHYWIYRERLAGGGAPPRWYLHGLFSQVA